MFGRSTALPYGSSQADFAALIDDRRVHYFTLRPQPARDVTSPTVTITSFLPNSSLSKMVDLVATASDDVGVTRVEFYVDNVLLATVTSAPYRVSWNTATVADGAHILLARAYDAAGNVGVSTPITITVDNTPPAVALISPQDGAIVSGPVEIAAAASDNIGVARVEFYLNGSIFLSSDSVAPYTLDWDSSGVSDGKHTLSARAVDRAGNITVSGSVTITVSNSSDSPPPTISITSPRHGATVPRRSTVTITAHSPDMDIARVVLYVNGTMVCSDSSSEYSCRWDVPAPPNRTYLLQARAYDSAGQMGSSPIVTVTSR